MTRTPAVPTQQVCNDRAIVTEWRFAPGAETGWHRHAHDYVVVVITAGKLMQETENGEIVTELAPDGASDEAYAALLDAFSIEEATFLNVAIATINAWNRLGVALRFAPLALRAYSPPPAP